MCIFRAPKPPKVQPPAPPPPTPPAPPAPKPLPFPDTKSLESDQEAQIKYGSKRKRQPRGSRSRGANSLRVNINAPGGKGGINNV